ADRDLLDVARIERALVDALEAAREQDRARALRKLPHARLREWRPARRQVERRRAGRTRGAGGVDGRRGNIGTHHHTGSATRRSVVDGAVLIGGEVTDVDNVERPRTP